MTVHLPPLSPVTILTIAGGVFAAAALVIAWRIWRRVRTSPEERERLRRAALAARGKVSDATLIEIRDNLLWYSYTVRGIEYTASQDISAIRDTIPADVVLGMGPVYVKYNSQNPANSIILAEQWCGLHAPRGR